MKATTALFCLSALISTAVATPIIQLGTPIIQRDVPIYTTPGEGRTVTVMKGDTLFKIAEYIENVAGACDIAAANNIKNPDDIVEGMLLKIPTVAAGKQDNESCVPPGHVH